MSARALAVADVGDGCWVAVQAVQVERLFGASIYERIYTHYKAAAGRLKGSERVLRRVCVCVES